MIKIKRIKNINKYKNIIKEIYLDAYQNVNPEYYEHTEEDIESYFNWLINKAPDGFILAFINKTPIGFLVIDLDWWDKKLNEVMGEIHEICIKKKYQKFGIGTKLVKFAEKLAKQRGLKYLGGWVGISNFQSLNFFKKLGFEEGEVGWEIWKRIRKRLAEI